MYEIARKKYEKLGIDTEAAIKKLAGVPISIHCWQGDDVSGFDTKEALSGGIQATGNYPGKATTPEQLMALSAENLSPEAAAKLAESLGRNREAEYLERLTQARIEDMKEMMKMGNEASREYIRASAPGAAQQPGKFCPSCGSRNNADAKFCMSCGAPIN